MMLKPDGKNNVDELYRREAGEQSDNHIMEEKERPERGRRWTRGTDRGGKSSHKENEKQQSRRNRQYTNRDAQKPRGRTHDRTDNNIPRYIHNGSMSEDFLQSIIRPIKKKPNATTCEGHRTSLLVHASNVMIRIGLLTSKNRRSNWARS